MLSRGRFYGRTAAVLGLTGGGAWVASCGVVLWSASRLRAVAASPARGLPILVLGCPPGPAFVRRLRHAAALAGASAAPRVVVSGRGEAAWGVEFLRGAELEGVELYAETAARNTWENLRFGPPLVGEGPFHLVTDAWHMPRALAVARTLGLPARAAPAPAPTRPAALGREGLSVVMSVSGGHVPLGAYWAVLREAAPGARCAPNQ